MVTVWRRLAMTARADTKAGRRTGSASMGCGHQAVADPSCSDLGALRLGFGKKLGAGVSEHEEAATVKRVRRADPGSGARRSRLGAIEISRSGRRWRSPGCSPWRAVGGRQRACGVAGFVRGDSRDQLTWGRPRRTCCGTHAQAIH
ncbi:putative pollen-specific leucine-rich repeat extensin-like protein 3 [Iris pallida]|uniref:Pollen-specific leucine-rich repeat extensin-like protein 3 n=1 Tax=Iris pallida TaxID=29817 RepID=A0AAX6G477_IRIPA|nr:putative pollen-specific leucine-rich repeat extensin-like protein 3 [Iris pallida]